MNFMIKDFELILLIVTFTTTYVDFINSKFGRKYDKKPFNCAFCLTIWTTLLVYILSLFGLVNCSELIFISPLVLRIIERRLL
jgi:hypothetical protein